MAHISALEAHAVGNLGEFRVFRSHYSEDHEEKKLSWNIGPDLEGQLATRGVPIYFSLFKKQKYGSVSFDINSCAEKLGDLATKVVHLDYSDLIHGLEVVLPTFIDHLGNETYAVGLYPGKSSTWVAAVSLEVSQSNHLKLPLPNSSWAHALDGSAGALIVDKQFFPGKVVDVKAENFVLFDDVSYTGSQLTFIVSRLLRELKKRPISEKFGIYLVVPFVSSDAIQKLRNALEEVPANVSIELLTTDKELPSDDRMGGKYAKLGLGALIAKPLLVFTDWKVPDFLSFPEELIPYIQPKLRVPPYRVVPE